MKALSAISNSAVAVRREMRLHVGREFLRVYEYVTVVPESGPKMTLGRPQDKRPNTPGNYTALLALYPTLAPTRHAAAA